MARRLTVMTSLVGSGGTQRQQRTKNGRNKRRVALSEGLPAVSHKAVSLLMPSVVLTPHDGRSGTYWPKAGNRILAGAGSYPIQS